MLAKLFAQKPDSNSREMEITCLKKCNSKLPPIGDNPDIYSSDRMVLQVGSWSQKISPLTLAKVNQPPWLHQLAVLFTGWAVFFICLFTLH
jgi:hypothetical protein